MPAPPGGISSRDGGLIKAVLDDIVSKKATDLSGFEKFGRNFNPVGDVAEDMPRLIVTTGANVLTLRTSENEFRSVGINFIIYANTEEEIETQGDLLDTYLNSLAENVQPISALMHSDAKAREMDILDQQTTHEQPNLWSRTVPTEWDIGISRS